MLKSFRLFTICLVLLFAASTVFAYPSGGSAPVTEPATEANSPFAGTVVETMNSGGYTYCLLDNGNQENWAAMPQTELKVGEEIRIQPGMAMQNFSSKTLNRTFDVIYFTQGVVKP